MKAMCAKIGMGKASPWALAALSVAVVGCSGNNNGSAASVAPAALAASTFSAPSAIQGSQTIIALDPINQAIWVPSHTLDASGNLQYELISTAAAVAGGTATGSKSVSLASCDTPIGIAYAASISALLVECGNSTTQALSLSAVDAKTLTVTPIGTPGLTWNGNYGGIIYDPQHSQAFVAGSQTFGLLQAPAGGAPSFEANSVTILPVDPNTGVVDNNVVSISMDFTTQQVVIADPSTAQPFLVDASTVNTTAPALNITQLPQIINLDNTQGSSGQPTPFQGAAFDSATDVLALSGNFGTSTSGGFYNNDVVSALNMATFSAAASSPTVNSAWFEGFLEYYAGPYQNNTAIPSATGGLAALNAATHQVLVADAWGPNLLLVQLPTTPPGPHGEMDNNGQPSTAGLPGPRPADATSAYAIAQTLVGSIQTSGSPTQLNTIGTPPALAIDQVNNIAYVLADDSLAPHAWSASPAGVTLALVSVDLSAPVFGGCPSPISLCVTTWNPRRAQAVVP
jgi:hypothetical protein